MVANGSVSCPVMILSSASRCASSARSVDERDRLAIALVDRSRPFEDGGDPEAVEPGVAMMALVDLDARDGVAMALVGQRVELAVAAIFAACN